MFLLFPSCLCNFAAVPLHPKNVMNRSLFLKTRNENSKKTYGYGIGSRFRDSGVIGC